MAIAERKLTRLGRCAREGCTKPHVLGDRFCFDHLDPDELEAALNEPDDEDPIERITRLEAATALSAPPMEVTPMPAAKTSGRLDPPWACACGRFSTDWPASKAKHLLACDGTPPATSGRIAARTSGSSTSSQGSKREAVRRTPPAAKKVRKAARRAVRPRKKRDVALVPVDNGGGRHYSVAPAAGASLRVTFLGQLHDARDRIDTAITAIEALG